MAEFTGLTLIQRQGYSGVYTLPISSSHNFIYCSVNSQNVLVPVSSSITSCSNSISTYNNYSQLKSLLSDTYNVIIPDLNGATNVVFSISNGYLDISNPTPLFGYAYITSPTIPINGNILYKYTIEESSGGESSGGESSDPTDMSGVISAILMIPAVLIVIAAFSVIYRIFINRRVRA